MGLAICSLTEVILINGKNIVNLALAVNITVMTMMVRSQSGVKQALTSFEGRLKILHLTHTHHQVGRKAGKAFGDTGSSNPGICHWEQMSQRPTFWITATVSPTARKLSARFFSFSYFPGSQFLVKYF